MDSEAPKTRIVLVTGAAGALGQAVAQAFLQSGDQVVLVDRSLHRLESLYPTQIDNPSVGFAAPYDLQEPESVDTLIDKTLAQYGRIDCLANTVGGYQPGLLEDRDALQILTEQINLNIKTSFNLTRAVLPAMKKQSHGKIIHTAGRAALAGSSAHTAYSIAKAGVLRLVESASAEAKPWHINVNCILPGTIDTPGNRNAMPGADTSTWVPAEDIAAVFLFLASDSARSIHGAAIPVYGLG